MPVERLRGGNAKVHEAIGCHEPVARIGRLGLIAKKYEEAMEDKGLADCECELDETRNDDGC